MKKNTINLIAAIFLLLAFTCARAQAYDDPMLSFEWGDAPKGMDNFPSFDSGKSFDMPSFEMRSGAGNDFLKNNTPTFGGEAWSKPAQTENIKAQGGSWQENQGSGFAEPLSEQMQRGVDKRVYKENTFTPTFGGEAWSKPAQTESVKTQGGSWRGNQSSGFAEPSYEQPSGVDKQVYKENTFTPTFGEEAWSKPSRTEVPAQTKSSVPRFSVPTYAPAPSGVDKSAYKEAQSVPAYEQQRGVDKRVYKENTFTPAFGGEAWSKPTQTEIKAQRDSWRQNPGADFPEPAYAQQQNGADKQVYNKEADFTAVKGLDRGQIREAPSVNMALPVFQQREGRPGRADMYSAKEGSRRPVNLRTAQAVPGVPVMNNMFLPEQVLGLPKMKKSKTGAMEIKEEALPRISLAGLLLKLGFPLILCSGLVWVLVKEGRHILDPLKLHIAKERLSAGGSGIERRA